MLLKRRLCFLLFFFLAVAPFVLFVVRKAHEVQFAKFVPGVTVPERPVCRTERRSEDAHLCGKLNELLVLFEVSLVMAWRNDGYGGVGSVKRFQLTLDMMASQMIDAKVNNVELIIVEFNPPAGEKKLVEVIRLPAGIPCVVIIELDADFYAFIQSFFPGRTNVAIPFAETRNIALRRARGQYIVPIATNSVLSSSFYRMIAVEGAIKKTEQGFSKVIHRIPKVFVSKVAPDDLQLSEFEAFLVSNSENATYVHHSSSPSRKVLKEELAPGDFQMMSRENWMLVRGYFECPSYGHHDVILLYNALAEGFMGVSHDMLVLHQFHQEGGYDNNIRSLSVPVTDRHLFKSGKRLNPNDCDWGLRGKVLKQTNIDYKTKA